MKSAVRYGLIAAFGAAIVLAGPRHAYAQG
jgi:hypothetical protein